MQPASKPHLSISEAPQLTTGAWFLNQKYQWTFSIADPLSP